jgi:hypothetical protein
LKYDGSKFITEKDDVEPFAPADDHRNGKSSSAGKQKEESPEGSTK